MWDFGEGKPISLKLMEHQCRLGLQWLKKGEIEGMIFHCTPLCDMKLEAVEWSKNWIARHGDDTMSRYLLTWTVLAGAMTVNPVVGAGSETAQAGTGPRCRRPLRVARRRRRNMSPPSRRSGC